MLWTLLSLLVDNALPTNVLGPSPLTTSMLFCLSTLTSCLLACQACNILEPGCQHHCCWLPSRPYPPHAVSHFQAACQPLWTTGEMKNTNRKIMSCGLSRHAEASQCSQLNIVFHPRHFSTDAAVFPSFLSTSCRKFTADSYTSLPTFSVDIYSVSAQIAGENDTSSQ